MKCLSALAYSGSLNRPWSCEFPSHRHEFYPTFFSGHACRGSRSLPCATRPIALWMVNFHSASTAFLRQSSLPASSQRVRGSEGEWCGTSQAQAPFSSPAGCWRPSVSGLSLCVIWLLLPGVVYRECAFWFGCFFHWEYNF